MPASGDPTRSVDRELEQACQALEDASKARDADISDAALINRLYYAAFHAVQAVLYDRGFNPGSHGGVRSLFGSEIIVAGDATRSDGRFLSQLAELRQQADYGYDELDEDVDVLQTRTNELVNDMEARSSERERGSASEYGLTGRVNG